MAGQLNFPLQPGTQVTSQSLEPTRFNVMHYQFFILVRSVPNASIHLT
jgi:hypothetical protein